MPPSHLLDLPTELVDIVVDQLPTNDVLSLRILNRTYHATLTQTLQDRCKTIYVHPSPTSLSRLEDICNHGALANDVEEVVFLGPIDRRFRSTTADTNTLRDLNNHPWPHTYTSSRTAINSRQNYTELRRTESTLFETAYKPLIDLLEKLPKLCKAWYASSADKPGFNAVSQTDITASARANEDFGRVYDRSSMRDMSLAKHTIRWSDEEVFYGVLAAAHLRITHLDLRGLLFHDLGRMRHELLPSTDNNMEIRVLGLAGRNLTTFACSTGRYGNEVLSRASTNLRELVVDIPPSDVPLRCRTLMGYLGGEQHHHPNLRSIAMRCLGGEENTLEFHEFLKPFLERHKDTLRTLMLNNIALVQQHDTLVSANQWTTNTLDATQDAVVYMSDRLQLEKSSFVLKFMAPGDARDVAAQTFSVTTDDLGYFDFGPYIVGASSPERNDGSHDE